MARPPAAATAAGAAGAPAEPVVVHRVRFVDFAPSGVQCVAFDPAGARVAVVRESGDVELWAAMPDGTLVMQQVRWWAAARPLRRHASESSR